MAANTITALNPTNWRPMVQDFLNNMLVVKPLSRTEFRAELRDGETIDWPYMDDVRVQSYSPGTDVTIDALNATSDTMDIDQSRIVSFPVDPTEKAQARDKAFPVKMARQAAFRLSNEIDQNVISTGVTAASSTVAGGSLTSSNFFSKITDSMAALQRANGADGPLYGIVDPERRALLSQVFVGNGFDEADVSLRNGFVGSAAGFEIYVSNNLPVSQTLSMATNPTNADTITVAGVTFTFVTNGTAANAGEISIAGSVGATQPIVVNAINGTGTPGASTYIEVSTENRRKLQNAQISAATFAANASVVTGFGKIGGAETFTDPTDAWGTETGTMLFGRKGATSLGMQMMPDLYIRPEPKQLQDNYLTHTLYGKKVFHRDADRLVKMTYNV